MAAVVPRDSDVHFHFDAQQPHQLAAVDAVADLLRGQPRSRFGAHAPQKLFVDDARLGKNLDEIRVRNGLPLAEHFDGHAASVDMETGTGKTYVYLRTLRELHRRYGFDRFVVVVPSVAIREGLLQQATAMGAHFGELYPETTVHTRVYRPGRDADIRRFAFDEGVQVLVLNIDAFNKGRGNLIHRPTDALRGHAPIDLIAGRRPVVILDEPQNLEGPKARAAVEALAPLLTLRYSATHRRLVNLVYRLDPVQAYDLGLVKRIEVASVVAEQEGPPPIEVKRIRANTRGVSASIVLEVAGPSGPVRKTVTVRGAGEDLEGLSGRAVYQGWVVSAVDAHAGCVRFSNGVVVEAGSVVAPEARAAVMRQQLEETIREHLETELRVHRLQAEPERMKVLSLVFVDRVSSYMGEGGAPGVVQQWFDAAYDRLASRPRYASLVLPPANAVRAAYFSERRGEAVDTSGKTKDDDAAYTLIMQDKTRLLSLAEPVRFVFSHSALREGWDNPNVFQICTLHRTRSELRKRQEIGRGLRLPVMANGRRCHDPDLARLTVIANESYESFARRLQAELTEDCAVDFGDRVIDKRAMDRVSLRDGWQEDAAFRAVWSQIGRPLRPTIRFSVDRLREVCVAAVSGLPAQGASTVVARRARVDVNREGVSATAVEEARRVDVAVEGGGGAIPDPLALLQRETGLTRATLAHALVNSGRLPDLTRDPIGFLDAAAGAIRDATRRLASEHVGYVCVSEHPVSMVGFEGRVGARSGRHLVPMTCSIYQGLTARSEAEAGWLTGLERDRAVSHVMRWPSWHCIDSPMGPLDLGWIVMRAEKLLCFPEKQVTSDPASNACMVAACEALGVALADRSVC